MKKFIIVAVIALICSSALAQTQTIYKFTPIKDINVTSVKNQARTGTCWCFATISFLEAELIRMGKGEYDLSEMYVVRQNYYKRINDNYLRLGKGNIGPGSIAHMAINVLKENGLVPEEVYRGINYNSETHNHTELGAYLKGIADVSVALKVKSPQYYKLIDNLFDTYLGIVPEEFTYNGKKYTPKTFANSLGLVPEDYIELTSFSHHPFYQQVPLEIRDNWDNQLLYNVPLDDMMAIIDNALENGYTVAWDGDLISGSFNHNRGVAINPEPKDKEEAVKLNKIYPEMVVTQENRQHDFETFNTVDDHLMHLTGIYKDQNGTKFYKTKNSWGTGRNEEMKGYLYMSKSYIQMRTISFMVHKNAIPKAIREKLNIK
ncbi:MAG: C1 family peptidase [Bacteroidales bacterium]|nr:C1 family peptidase [Bacteroidales bacterium]MDD4670202.1 C1 family peptidase [Bacteroidales bacterium]